MKINKGNYQGISYYVIGGCQIPESELWKYYNKKYIVNSRGVYQIFYSEAQKGFYGQKVINKTGLTKKGRYFAFTGSYINKFVGAEILRDF